MPKSRSIVVAIGVLWMLAMTTSYQRLHACTIFTLIIGDQVFFGNNEDYMKPGAVWFVPATDGKLGRINFGFHDWKGEIDYFAQGSMNEKGLVFDAAALAKVDWEADPEKPTPENLLELIMDTCSTVAEAEKMIRENNCKYLAVSQFLFADATGDSAIFTWNQGTGLSVVHRKGNQQVVTNTRLDVMNYRCARWTKANQVLKSVENPTRETIRDALNAVHQHGKGFTSYSTIYDLKKQKVYVYNLANFDETVELDLHDELKKGKASHLLKDLFQNSPKLADIRAKRQRDDFGTRIDLEAASLERLKGTYVTETSPQVTVRIEVRDGNLAVVSPGKPDAILFPESEQMFRLAPDRGQVSFQFDSEKQVESLTLHKQVDVVAKKVTPPN